MEFREGEDTPLKYSLLSFSDRITYCRDCTAWCDGYSPVRQSPWQVPRFTDSATGPLKLVRGEDLVFAPLS